MPGVLPLDAIGHASMIFISPPNAGVLYHISLMWFDPSDQKNVQPVRKEASAICDLF